MMSSSQPCFWIGLQLTSNNLDWTRCMSRRNRWHCFIHNYIESLVSSTYLAPLARTLVGCNFKAFLKCWPERTCSHRASRMHCKFACLLRRNMRAQCKIDHGYYLGLHAAAKQITPSLEHNSKLKSSGTKEKKMVSRSTSRARTHWITPQHDEHHTPAC